MTKKQIALAAVQALKKEYPDAVCSLEATDPFQLLVATILAAQCTDARVNIVTPALFDKYPAVEDYAAADIEDIENMIHSCGFYHAKARYIIDTAQMLLSEFGGSVPDTIEDLIKLPESAEKQPISFAVIFTGNRR